MKNYFVILVIVLLVIAGAGIWLVQNNRASVEEEQIKEEAINIQEDNAELNKMSEEGVPNSINDDLKNIAGENASNTENNNATSEDSNLENIANDLNSDINSLNNDLDSIASTTDEDINDDLLNISQ